jgi:threonine/homoserine/homoserine lactone efflux protein
MNLLLFLFQVFVISFSGALQPGPVTATAITMGARNRWAGVLLAVGHGIIEFPLMLLIILGLGSLFQKPTTQITIGLIGGLVLIYMACSMFKSSSSATSNEALGGVPLEISKKFQGRNPWWSPGLTGQSPGNLSDFSGSFWRDEHRASSIENPVSNIEHPVSNIENRESSIKYRALLAGFLLTASNPYFLIWWATVGLALATRATQFGLHAFVLFAITHWLVDLLWVTALSFAAFHGTSLLGPKSQTIILKLCAAAMLLFALFFLYSSASLLLKR